MNREKQIYKVTIMGGIVNTLLMLFKFVAGIFGHSSAMIADAFHSLSDFASDIVVIVFVKLSGKPEDRHHSYGHGKFETLASLIVGLMLAAVGIGLALEGVKKCIFYFEGGQLETPGTLALVAALISVFLKEGLFRYTIRQSSQLNSNALKANAWHHRSDAMTSLATLAGIGGAILLGERWNVLDPLAAVIVSGFIIKTSWSLMKPALEELLEKSLPEDELADIVGMVNSIPEIKSYHRLRTRRVGPNRAIEIHIILDPDMTLDKAHAIASELEHKIKTEFGSDTHIGIHMEPANR